MSTQPYGVIGHVKAEIFPFTVVFCCGVITADSLWDELVEVCKSDDLPISKARIQEKVEEINGRRQAAGHCWAFDNLLASVVMIWMRDNLEEDSLAHEAFHASCHLLRGIGLPLDESSEEAYAYTLGWIVSQFHLGLDAFFEKARTPG